MLQDFPLSGFVEVRYDEDQKRVICEPLELAQVSTTSFLSNALVSLGVGLASIHVSVSSPFVNMFDCVSFLSQEFRRFEYASPWEQVGTGGTVTKADI
jgi:hypothetical protein